MEGVAYQSTLLFWFEKYCEDTGISGFEFVELGPKNQAKNNRIKRGLLRVMASEIYLHPRVRSQVCSQVMEWNPLKTDNKDDIIDPIGYVEELMKEYPHLIVKNIFDVDSMPAESSHVGTLALPF